MLSGESPAPVRDHSLLFHKSAVHKDELYHDPGLSTLHHLPPHMPATHLHLEEEASGGDLWMLLSKVASSGVV